VEKCQPKRKNREMLAQLKKTKQDLEKQLDHHQRMDRKLHESEERFREIVDHIREVFWLFDKDSSKTVYAGNVGIRTGKVDPLGEAPLPSKRNRLL